MILTAGLVAVAALAATWPAFRWLDSRTYRYADEADVRLRSHRWVLVGLPVLVAAVAFGQVRSVGPAAAVVTGALAGILVVASAIDLDVRRLPDKFTLPLMPATAVGLALVALIDGDWSDWLRAVLAGVATGAVFFVLALIGGGNGMGLGDVKLAPTLGMLLGWHSWTHVLVGNFVAFLAAALVGLVLMVVAKRGRKSTIPFGPFMVGGALLLLAAPMLATAN